MDIVPEPRVLVVLDREDGYVLQIRERLGRVISPARM
jgi:hypothetical protein